MKNAAGLRLKALAAKNIKTKASWLFKPAKLSRDVFLCI